MRGQVRKGDKDAWASVLDRDPTGRRWPLGSSSTQAWSRLYVYHAIMGLVNREFSLVPQATTQWDTSEFASDLEKVREHLGVERPTVTQAAHDEINVCNGGAELAYREVPDSFAPE